MKEHISSCVRRGQSHTHIHTYLQAYIHMRICKYLTHGLPCRPCCHIGARKQNKISIEAVVMSQDCLSLSNTSGALCPVLDPGPTPPRVGSPEPREAFFAPIPRSSSSRQLSADSRRRARGIDDKRSSSLSPCAEGGTGVPRAPCVSRVPVVDVGFRTSEALQSGGACVYTGHLAKPLS